VPRIQSHFQLSFISAVVAALMLTLSVDILLSAEAPPDLRTARFEHRRDLLMALLPEKKAYLESLLTLERRLATKGDYAAAMHTRDERIAVEQEIKTIEHEIPVLTTLALNLRTAPLPDRALFLSRDATNQSLKFDPKTNALTGWDSESASARWTLPNLPPGGYEVLLTYANPAQKSVTLEVKESFYSLRGTLDATSDKTLEKNLGTLRIRDGKSSLILGAVKNGTGEKLQVFSLALVPANK